MSGYSKRELEDIQRTWKLRFPPDLVKIYQQRRSVIENEFGFDWISTPSRKIRYMIEFPVESYLDEVRHGEWWPEWGERPRKEAEAEKLFLSIVAKAPKLIPIYGHRCIPEEPHESGNPVFSVWGADIIYYGANLPDYVERETRKTGDWPKMGKVKTIPFWSRAVELNGAAG